MNDKILDVSTINSLEEMSKKACSCACGGHCFGGYVCDPSYFGVPRTINAQLSIDYSHWKNSIVPSVTIK